MIFENTFQHLAFYRYRTRLPIQIMILKMTLTKLFLINVIAKAIKLIQPIFINHLSCES